MLSEKARSLSDAASDAEARCGARIRELESAGELAEAFDLFNGIWGGDERGAVPINVMKALAHTRNYLAGAWQDEKLVGAAVGFAWGDLPARALHSHIAGVLHGSQGAGIGYALKLHQRAWAAERGYTRITWTFDPLVRRNGWFNLTKLGTRIEEYQPDFYGPMRDGINAGDPTDRCLVVWDVHTSPNSGTSAKPSAPALALLVCEDGDTPVVTSAARADWKGASCLSCQVPADAVQLRRSDPELALRWRRALRETMNAAVDAGFVASAMTRDGCYILERPREETG